MTGLRRALVGIASAGAASGAAVVLVVANSDHTSERGALVAVTLVVGALLWNYLSWLYNEIAMSIAYERWEGTLEYTFMAPVSSAVKPAVRRSSVAFKVAVRGRKRPLASAKIISPSPDSGLYSTDPPIRCSPSRRSQAGPGRLDPPSRPLFRDPRSGPPGATLSLRSPRSARMTCRPGSPTGKRMTSSCARRSA